MNLLLAFGLVLLSSAGTFALPFFAPVEPIFAVTLATLGLSLILSVTWRRDGALPAMTTAFAAILLVSASMVLAWDLGARLRDVPGTAPFFATLLGTLGLDATANNALLYVAVGGDAVPFSLTWDKLGLLPALSVLSLMILFAPSASMVRWLSRMGVIVTLFGAYLTGRYVFLVALCLNHDDPMNRMDPIQGPLAVEVFRHPWWQLGTFLPLALVIAPVFRAGPVGNGVLFPRKRWAMAAATLLALVSGGSFALDRYEPHTGERKQGRILIDDSHSPDWETADVSFGKDSFGRDAVYNLATFVDYLRGYYDVSVKRAGDLDRACLDAFDVVVLKTPTRPYRSIEIDALHAWVENGGGLYLVGDHTNLLGMTTHLNAVAERFGMTFREDACNNAFDGGFTRHGSSHPRLHPCTADIDKFELMTSCTLSISPDADPAMIVGAAFSDPMDYGAPSFFGNVIPDLQDAIGPQIVAATMEVGAGRVAAFGDSTVFSNFAVLHEGRAEYVLGTIEYLNRRNVLSHRSPGWGAICLLGASLAFLLLQWAGPSAWAMRRSLVLGVTSLGFLIGAGFVQSTCAIDLPDPHSGFRRVAFVKNDTYSLPPALVDLEIPPWEAFDVFFLSFQRMGLFPKLTTLDQATDPEEGFEAIVIINPEESLDDARLHQLGEYLEEGGRVLVMDSLRNADSKINHYLNPFGIRAVSDLVTVPNEFASESWRKRVSPGRDTPFESLSYGKTEAPIIESGLGIPILALEGGATVYQTSTGQALAAVQHVGAGKLLAIADSTGFSGQALGRPSDELEPWDSRRAVFDAVYRLVEDVLLSDATVPTTTNPLEDATVVATPQ